MLARTLFLACLFTLTFGCTKKDPVGTTTGEVPSTGGEPPAPRATLACLGVYETTEAEIAKQTLTFSDNGQCKFVHDGFPETPYTCTYEVTDPHNAKVILLVTGTTEGWNFESRFTEDCATVEPAGFGLKFSRKP